MPSNDIEKLTEHIRNFVEAREWSQFQTPKDLALPLALEAAEVLEHFQWKNGPEVDEYLQKNKEEVSDELADVFIYLLEICHYLDIDIIDAAYKKMKKNAKKYPVEKAKGRLVKYTEL